MSVQSGAKVAITVIGVGMGLAFWLPKPWAAAALLACLAALLAVAWRERERW